MNNNDEAEVFKSVEALKKETTPSKIKSHQNFSLINVPYPAKSELQQGL